MTQPHRRKSSLTVEARLRVSLCLLFAALTAWIVGEPLGAYRELVRVESLIRDVRQLSSVLCAVEDEGAWATAVAATGATRYSVELKSAAAETDKKLDDAAGLLDGEAAHRAGAAQAENALRSRLQRLREFVLSRQRSSQETAAAYRVFGGELMERIRTRSAGCSDVRVSRRLDRWMDFLRLQQAFSAERANTAAVLNDEGFGPDSLRRHWETLASESQLLERLSSSDENHAAWTQLWSEDNAAGMRVLQVRSILADKQSDGAFGVGPEEWTKVSAEAAKSLRERGLGVLQEIEAAGATARAAALRTAGMAAAVGLGGLVVALLILHRHGVALRRALQTVNTRLHQLADRISDQSQTSSAAGSGLASGAEQQGQALERYLPTVKQIAAGSEQNARIAQKARESCESASAEVRQTSQGAAELAKTLERLSAASDRIAEISRTVEEIAFQTNLLALNASIEAARAGAAGAGFAVVAEEVRALAQRSAEAAKSSGEIVHSSSELSRGSVGLIEALRTRLGATEARIASAATQLCEISRSASEQSAGTQDLHAAVEEIEGAAKANLGFADELADSSQALLSLDRELRDVIDQLGVLVEQRTSSRTPKPNPVRPVPARKLSALLMGTQTAAASR